MSEKNWETWNSNYVKSGDKEAFEVENWTYTQHNDNHQLHLLKKLNTQAKNRPLFPTTENERLAFYRAYSTTAFKLQISYMEQINFTGYFWMCIQNILLKNFPTYYIHMFYATYNSQTHFFGSKMFPLCYGLNWQIIMCGILQLTASADCLAMYIHFGSGTLAGGNPWSKCSRNWTLVKPIPKPYRCYTLKQFYNIVRHLHYGGNDTNTSYDSKYNCYHSLKNDTLFTISHIDYFIRKWVKLNVISYFNFDDDSNLIVHLCLIWIVSALFYRQLYKRYLWKVLLRLQQIVLFLYTATLLYLLAYGMEVKVKRNILWQAKQEQDTFYLAKLWDFGFNAESISGPPVVHLLSSRTHQMVNPARDSVLVTISNSLMYFYKALVHYKMKTYVEYKIKAPVYVSSINPYPIFYLWPIFFDTFYFGPVIGKIFFIVLALSETFLFLITYQLLVDVIVCEIKWARRWLITVLISVVGLSLSLTLGYTTKMLLYIFITSITSLTETVVVCWLYPVRRLMDDMYFHNGTPVTTWRIWSFRMLPLFFVYKIYFIFDGFIDDMHSDTAFVNRQRNTVNADYSPTEWAWLVGVLPLPLGALYAVFKYVISEKKGWRYLLNPRPDWGPMDHLSRQLRKLFESRKYVSSQASRYLSRLLMDKAQHITYRLNICYVAKSHSPDIARYEGEWKNT